MTEQDAINALVSELEAGDEQVTEGQTEPQGSEPAETQQTEHPQITQENLQNMIASAMQGIEEQKAAQEAEKAKAAEQAKAVQLPPEQQALLDSMGLQGMPQMQEQIRQLQEAQAQAQEAARKRAVFDKNLDQFSKDYPTIKPEEMGKWAEQNGFLSLLGENYDGWKAVANAMIKIATPTQKPDEIIDTNRSGGELSAFDRIKKGEDVSDVEIGAELLKQAGF